MAAARDQAARIVRAGPETARGWKPRAEAGRPLADQAADSRRGRTSGAAPPRRPAHPAIDTAGAPPAGNADAAAETGQAQIRHDGRRS